MTQTHQTETPREKLTLAKIIRFLTLPFCPGKLKTLLAVRRFEDIDPDFLKSLGIKGVLIDADGTLGPHRATSYSESVKSHIAHFQNCGLGVAIFTNAREDRFGQFPGVSIVSNVPAKPDPRGFILAMERFLHLNVPETACMIGDNYLTDGGAIGAGLHFIHVDPVAGPEKRFHSGCRRIALFFAKLYFPETFRNGRV